MAFYLIMVALFVKEISSQLVSTTTFIFYLNMVTFSLRRLAVRLYQQPRCYLFSLAESTMDSGCRYQKHVQELILLTI